MPEPVQINIIRARKYPRQQKALRNGDQRSFSGQIKFYQLSVGFIVGKTAIFLK